MKQENRILLGLLKQSYKKILSFTLSLVLLLFLTGCDILNHDITNEGDNMKTISVTTVSYFDAKSDDIQFYVELNEDILKDTKTIKTEHDAKIIAKSIIDQLHRDNRFLDYTLISIIHSIEDNIWCFEYSLDQIDTDPDELVDCGSLYVVIDGNKGELIQSWLEE